MTKQEFLSKVNEIYVSHGEYSIEGDSVSEADWEIIQHVYNWHPSIRNVCGKVDIAEIFCLYNGMQIIRDMLPTAKEYEKNDARRRERCRELLAARKAIGAKIKELWDNIHSIDQEIEELRKTL